MRINHIRSVGAVFAALVMAACGPKPGANTGGGGGGGGGGHSGVSAACQKDPTSPKCISGGQHAEITKIRDTVSADAKKDWEEAVAYYLEQTKGGWNSDVCAAVAGKFSGVANDHPKLIEARFDAGMAWHHCGQLDRAEGEYKKALAILANHAPTLSNMGEIEFKRGNVKRAQELWSKAIELDSKLVAARNNLAWLLLDQLRHTTDRSTWNKLEKDARDQLSSVLAVDQENVPAYVLYGLVYMEGSERNANRLDLAKLLLDEAGKRNDKFAPLYNARGLLFMRRKSPGPALEKFMQAVSLDPDFLEARMNVGNITLGFRKYDTAAEQFSYIIGKRSKDYDAHIGLGVAQRGLGKIDDAEKEYNAAKDIDPKRGAAYFNLGVLYKDFRANKASDLNGSKAMYQKAKSYFQDFLSKSDASSDDKDEAKENMKDCDKVMKQIDDAIKQQAADAAAAASGGGGGQ